MNINEFLEPLNNKKNISTGQFKALEFTKTNKIKTNNKELENQLGTLVSPTHLEAISKVAKKYNLTIGIRDTGAYSIKRINQGAKTKPHTILEKSIKPGSIKKGYSSPEDFKNMMDKVQKLDLDGFVGHWDSKGKLEGIRITNPPEGVTTQKKFDGNSNIEFVKIDFNQPDGGNALKSLKAQENWQKHLFTGDYDIHEIYKNNHQIAEASTEALINMSRLNQEIAKGNSERIGDFELHNGIFHIKENQEYAMFQHGSQATYQTNQIFEAKRDNASKAKLVKPVAQESNEPIAWCAKGDWYVTQGVNEHKALRTDLKITAPSSWQEIEYQKLNNNKNRVTEYTGNQSNKTQAEHLPIFQRPKNEAFFKNAKNENVILDKSKNLDQKSLGKKEASLAKNEPQKALTEQGFLDFMKKMGTPSVAPKHNAPLKGGKEQITKLEVSAAARDRKVGKYPKSKGRKL